MRKEDANKVINALKKIFAQKPMEVEDIPMGKIYGVKISKQEYEVLEPFLKMFIVTDYKLGHDKISFSGMAACGALIVDDEVYIDFYDSPNYLEWYVMMRKFMTMFSEIYKRIPISIYNKNHSLQ